MSGLPQGPTLLIGGMGFIGLHTARSFLDAGQDVVLTYHRHRREPDFLQPDLGTRARVEPLDVLEASRAAGVRRLTVTSSLAVYANVSRRPWREDAHFPPESSNPTEAYKKALEILGLFFGQRTGLEVVMLRVAGIFGPLYHSMANVPSRLAHAAAHGKAPDFSGMRYGPPKADDGGDACYVKDCAYGIQLVHSAPSLQHRIYNVGSGKATRNRELVDA